MDTIKIIKEKTLMIAHRGLSKIEKENTIPAFIAASNRSYYGIECDIHKTKDGKYAIIHDDDLSRVANSSLIISETNYQEINDVCLLDLDLSHHVNYYKVPLLEDYINICKKYSKKCIIEFKNEFNVNDINEVLDIINNLNYLDNCIFISFHISNLINIRLRYSNLPLQYLVSKFDENILNLCYTYKLSVDAHQNLITKDFVELFHSKGLLVNVWTVDDEKMASELVSLGVDFITTNILE